MSLRLVTVPDNEAVITSDPEITFTFKFSKVSTAFAFILRGLKEGILKDVKLVNF
ncbi:hypothetical protein D3C78_1714930 [compost metagenome]